MVTRDGVLLTWKGLTGIMTLVAAGAMFVAVQAQQRPGGATLSPQDYIEIQQLVARYPYALDGGLGRGAVYADLFTADGVFINQDGRHDGGRAALEGLGGSRRQRETPLNTAHYIVNHVIRSEEHTSELQSQSNLVCRLLLEKK